VIAERVDCDATDFGIFTSNIVFGDEGLNLIAHGLVERYLAGDRGTTRSFRTTTSFEYRPTIARRNTTQFSRTLAPG